jgi:diguanylate cyclase (GGDEF)-like protein
MSRGDKPEGSLYRVRWPFASLVLAAGFVALLWWLRRSTYAAEPATESYLEIVGSLIAFTYAANALVRFRGSHDRISLILAFGFVLSGLIEMISSVVGAPAAGDHMTIPLAWMVGRTLLAALLIAALVVEKHLPRSGEPGREIMASLLLVGGLAYLISALVLGAPKAPTIHAGAWIPRPWDLGPAAMFLAATAGYWRRVGGQASVFDRAICCAAALNVLCHVAASQSQGRLDAPFAFAQVLKVASYALVLGGALLDNARLFDQVRQLAVSDSLTGLANYRRFVEVLEAEVKRSERTGRSFAVLLLDLDRLKRINDRYGHLVGTRAIRRVAHVLRAHCRSMDTAARYGGDEFALVLPEASAKAAWQAAQRVVERLENDGEEPRLSVSLGVATYPQDGKKIELLLAAADHVLYEMKDRSDKRAAITKMAARR